MSAGQFLLNVTVFDAATNTDLYRWSFGPYDRHRGSAEFDQTMRLFKETYRMEMVPPAEATHLGACLRMMASGISVAVSLDSVSSLLNPDGLKYELSQRIPSAFRKR